MAILRIEDDNELAGCSYWLKDTEAGDGVDFCDAPSTSVAMPRGDWKGALPRCSEHLDLNRRYWIVMDFRRAHRVQSQMAAIELLEDHAYWAGGDPLSGLVGDGETFSRAAQFLAARLANILPERPGIVS